MRHAVGRAVVARTPLLVLVHIVSICRMPTLLSSSGWTCPLPVERTLSHPVQRISCAAAVSWPFRHATSRSITPPRLLPRRSGCACTPATSRIFDGMPEAGREQRTGHRAGSVNVRERHEPRKQGADRWIQDYAHKETITPGNCVQQEPSKYKTRAKTRPRRVKRHARACMQGG